MSFKFLRGDSDGRISLEPLQVLSLRPQRFNEVEYCYQFDDEEPVVFLSGDRRLEFTIEPQPNGNITFRQNGRTFKIFARERQ